MYCLYSADSFYNFLFLLLLGNIAMWKSIVNKGILIKCYRNKVYLEGIVLWIGIFLMLIRVRNSMLMPIQIRIRTGLVSKWCRSTCESYPKFQHPIFFTFSHSFASLQSFIFLISVKDIIIRSILDRKLKFCGASIVYNLFHMPGIDTDLDRHADPYKDPDSEKWCISGSTTPQSTYLL